MTKNNIIKDFAKYVSLNVISMIGMSFYILADTYFIANGVGSVGLTALNLVLPLWSLMSGIGLMIGIGAAISYSIKRGNNNEIGANRVFTHAMFMGIIISIIITSIGFLFSHDIVKALGADGSIAPLAGDYLKTLLSFSTVFIMNNIIMAFIRNDNAPKLAMIAMTLGTISNVVLDYVFIYTFKLGMFGAALATGTTPILSLIILSFHFIRKKNNFKLIKCKISLSYMRRIISLGIPSFITEVSSGIIILLFNFTILRISNNTGVAAYGIITNLAFIVISIFTGIAQGIQPIVSKNYGEGNYNNINSIFKYGGITAVVLGGICYLIGVSFSEEIVNLFNSERDEILLAMAIEGIKIYFIAFIIMGLNIVTTSFFASINEAKESFIISIMRALIVVVPLIIILPKLLGMTGVWLTIPLAEVITLLISIVFYIKYRKRINYIK